MENTGLLCNLGVSGLLGQIYIYCIHKMLILVADNICSLKVTYPLH